AVVAGYTLVRSPIQLLGLRLLHGLVVAVLAPGAFALAGDMARTEDRARVMGSNGAVIALAAIIAPALAGVLQDRGGFRTVFLCDAALLVIVASILWVFRARLRLPELGSSTTISHPTRWSALLRQQVAPYSIILGFSIALGVLVTHVPERLQALGISPAVRGVAFSLYGLVAAAVMISPISGRLVRQQWSMGAAAGAGLIALGLLIASGLGISSPAVTERTTLLGAAVFGFGFGLLFPAVTAEVARRVPRQARGRAFGFFYALYSLGVVFGALAAGWLAEFSGLTSGWPFAAGALAAAAGSIVPLVERRVRREAVV
ncbi:MAG: MFS transporter, partial [Thermomicrobium sp.]